jgi:hypothetical protein
MQSRLENRRPNFPRTWLTPPPSVSSSSAISITAGGSSQDEVRSVLAQLTADLPGFDLDSDVVFPAARHRAAIGAFIVPGLAAAALIGVPFIPADVIALATESFPEPPPRRGQVHPPRKE